MRHDGEWSDAIPGSGGSMFIEKESNGPHTSDEAIKMATTDALSVACKMLGFASDVYAGFWDGSKYNRPEEEKPVNIHVNETGWWSEAVPEKSHFNDTPVQTAINNVSEGEHYVF